MLGVALLARDAGAQADRVCHHLQQAVPETIPLLAIDASSSDGTAARLARLAAESHAQAVPLSGSSCDAGLATGIVRHLTGCAHVLILRPGDRLVAAALPRLAAFLDSQAPALAVLPGGWWVTEPHPGRQEAEAALPYPDAWRYAEAAHAAHPAGADLLGLTPDPRHLLPAEGTVAAHDPFLDPAMAWEAWEQALQDPGGVALFSEPVLLHALPDHSAAAAVAALRARLAAAPHRAVRADILRRAAPWLSDALSLSPATGAEQTRVQLEVLWVGLPRALRRLAQSLPGPSGEVFRALADGELRAALALLAGARQERVLAHIAARHRDLQGDLDIALPGPDYLADLYARVRGL